VAKEDKTAVVGKAGNGAVPGGDGVQAPANGAADAGAEPVNPQMDPAIIQKIAAVRAQVRESFGKTVMAMMMLPRYRNQTLGDLQHLVLEPLIRDRVAIAYPGKTENDQLADISGLAIWASVSEEVDGRIREQIRAGVFPVGLKAEDWTSGEINWLLDVIAPDQRTTASVIANFKQVVKEGSLRLHPIITRLVDEETLKKMGAERIVAPGSADAAA
jgi:cytolysin-activating lysine-acyltransferase